MGGLYKDKRIDRKPRSNFDFAVVATNTVVIHVLLLCKKSFALPQTATIFRTTRTHTSIIYIIGDLKNSERENRSII